MQLTRASDGVFVDPTTLVCKIRLPDKSVVDLTGAIVKTDVGKYSATYTALVEGIYTYEWISTGAAEAAVVGQFNVDPLTF
jgi:hypothetical protein